MTAWYATLRRPLLTPPDWIFSPVWTALYIMIATAIVLYYRSSHKPRLWLTTTVLGVHLLANLSWTYLFFGLRSPALALVDIAILDITLVLLFRWFGKTNRLAGLLLLPYLLWVLFATYLNVGFYRLN